MGTYLIIGASSGIGKATASLLAKEGHNVIGTYNTTNPTNITGVDFYQLNILDNTLDLHFLPESLDGVVYCPGSINLLPFARIKPQDFLDDYNLQVIGAIKTIQTCLKVLKKGTNPSIVLFSTVAVQHGFNFHTQVAASKGAIEGLTKSLAAELSPTIRVNCIAPSITQTALASKLLSSDAKLEANAQRHPLKKVGQAIDIAHMVAFLTSEKANWITGQIIGVDGGMSTLKI
ncbi:NAD(P)-dependent dehydrogenase (short-subunit alcohol dehydrogenase family) [Wenyingzhuangia heitensis]|uniref:NAD(P)-dependent dehydrogenase (Short-subunit alcohol dehydrogenase family) n=1 Tax=Wenyingzhuangia heitensis TaxID=1487859 RepID=A0ABX0U7H1_9FLAO|nr:SDR family oxidoreductase [Wenyingzhuangia heitensis]NIJ44757.1 NAD(P)-dependent dehydrogenase (short-subunit alcohol dehydrogenase family) [Wenyingzhuangia heitensis]